MNNPNSSPLSSEEDDDNDNEGFIPLSFKRPKKTLKVNDNLINFSLNTKKNQQIQHINEENNPRKDKKEENSKEPNKNTPGSKRKRVGGALRSLLKRNITNRDQASEQPLFKLPGSADLAPAAAGGAAANLKPVPEKPLDTTDSDNSTEVSTPTKEEQNESLVATPDTTAEATNTAPTVPPLLPRPSHTSSVGRTHGGGGNITPVSPAVRAANYMPSAMSPSAPNRQPIIVDRRNNWGPAIIVGLAERYFRRRADKRISRKIEKTNKQLEQIQSELIAEKRARRAEKNTPTPLSNGPEAPPVTTAAAVSLANQTRQEIQPVNNPDTRSEAAIISNNESMTVQYEKHAENLSKPVKAAEVFAASPLAKEMMERGYAQKEIIKEKEQRWQAPRNNEGVPEKIINEKVLDRRHEVKDGARNQPRQTVPAVQATLQSGTGGTQPATGGSSSTSATPPSNTTSQLPNSTKQIPQNIYKQSMQAGFAIGLIVAVLGIIAFIYVK